MKLLCLEHDVKLLSSAIVWLCGNLDGSELSVARQVEAVNLSSECVGRVCAGCDDLCVKSVCLKVAGCSVFVFILLRDDTARCTETKVIEECVVYGVYEGTEKTKDCGCL